MNVLTFSLNVQNSYLNVQGMSANVQSSPMNVLITFFVDVQCVNVKSLETNSIDYIPIDYNRKYITNIKIMYFFRCIKNIENMQWCNSYNEAHLVTFSVDVQSVKVKSLETNSRDYIPIDYSKKYITNIKIMTFFRCIKNIKNMQWGNFYSGLTTFGDTLDIHWRTLDICCHTWNIKMTILDIKRKS